jgi:PAS domain S-box-containing protein
MQTLELHLTAVFETMPGKNLLILPNPPFFAIASISKAYAKDAGLKVKQFIGHPVSELFNIDERSTGTARRRIMESLELAYETKESNYLFIDDPHGHQIRIEHKPVISEHGEVIYIIHRRRINKKVSAISRSELPQLSSNDQELTLVDILMQAPVAFAIVKGENFVLQSANMQMLELWDKQQDIIGKKIIDVLPELVGQRFPQLLENVYRTGVEYHGYETKAILRKGGVMTENYFNFLYAPIRNSRGETEGILMIASDVTNLVKTKKDLEESEKRYKDLIENATVATAVYVGPTMEILLANDAMTKLWGKDKSVIGKTLSEAIPELNGQPFFELLDSVWKTGVTYHSTEDKAELFVDGKKQTFYFNFTYKALRNSNGNIYGILNMAVDVTEIIESKNKLLETEERWRVALNSAELGTWDYYPATGEITCSPRTLELFGFTDERAPTPEELIKAVDENDHERIRKEVLNALQNQTTENLRVEYEVTGIHDSKPRWHRATGHVFFDQDKRPYRLTGTLLDITESKRIEEALEERVYLRTVQLLDANEKLERSNHELEQYAYVASHDLQEPLRKILVYSDLLKNNPMFQEGVDAMRLDKISSSAQRMSHLIQDLLNFSRLLKIENVFTPTPLAEVVRDVIDDFELKIQETKARIEIGILPEIEASPQQINQLFYNLISNGLKFRKENENPVIKISSKLLDPREVKKIKSLRSDLQYYCIAVQDNGIGFNEKYLDHVFEIFKRLHTKLSYEGTGIGLALCRKIARNHLGDITAESSEGKGSCFYVMLPAKQPGEKGE